MKILFLDAYFHPENVAYTHLEQDILAALVERGHEIDVICPMPSRGVDENTRIKYLNIPEETMYGGKVHIHRFPLWKEPESTLKRFIRYFVCDFKTYLKAKKFKADVVFAASTPPIQGLLAGKVAKKTGAKFVYNLQDIFPDSLITTGLSDKESVFFKIGRIVENKTYALADDIILISEDAKKNLLKKGVPEEKLTVVNNWININETRKIEKEENPLYDEFSIDREKFTVLYAGNMGASQNLEVIVDAAKLLENEKNIQFVFFGEGVARKNIENYAGEQVLNNVLFFPLQPPERISEVYSCGDVCAVTCSKGTGITGVPSKTWTIMACSKPVLLSFDKETELTEIIENNKLGLCADAGDSKTLAENILAFSRDRELCDKLGKNSRSYVENNASAEYCTKEYVKVMERNV